MQYGPRDSSLVEMMLTAAEREVEVFGPDYCAAVVRSLCWVLNRPGVHAPATGDDLVATALSMRDEAEFADELVRGERVSPACGRDDAAAVGHALWWALGHIDNPPLID